jgi:F-type H+-transporting ATPase subunit b
VEQGLAEAKQLQQEAESLKADYEGRLSQWQEERRSAREALVAELESERAQRLEALRASLEKERQKSLAAQARQDSSRQKELEEAALRQSATFASRLLEQASGPELEARLLDLLVEELGELSGQQASQLREQWDPSTSSIEVRTAYPVAQAQKERLQSALAKIFGQATEIRFLQDERVIAGACITAGAWVFGANLRDELRAFTQLAPTSDG